MSSTVSRKTEGEQQCLGHDRMGEKSLFCLFSFEVFPVHSYFLFRWSALHSVKWRKNETHNRPMQRKKAYSCPLKSLGLLGVAVFSVI